MRWKVKQGYGSHIYKGKVYKSGDIFEGPDHLGESGAKDKLESLNSEIEEMEEENTATFKAVHVGHGKYNVINEQTGKSINDIPLSRKEALQLVKENKIGQED